ncbi:hypothetical protein G6F16_011760 [Rhizopus arrhizus]|nr:hypothetical protein G6F23_009970 [Rhizopus arrhizus]KAG0755774.1 hypothetical protein G6F24_011605 [Rhizopus arrhizus]KAG0781739.1 hypothetical protein G6F21_011487 [Rhizopus arrhizus]KAG0805733.1 hypothetical protein G6F20_011670 [Rhizopus arrhizus]KAG0821879.1 hypothetical protein G6F19_011688 [Rhizopus arrhizus]
MEEQANRDLQPSVTQADGYQTRSKSRQPNVIENKNVYEMDGIVLDGMTRSVGSIIKTEARKLAESAKTYTDLTGEAKNSVFLGFNSIVDLSNNSTDEGSQCSFFSNEEWQQLKNLKIEKKARTDLKAAYRLSLDCQYKHAFSSDESYFEIYSHVIRLLNQDNSILKRSETATEQDFVGEAWTPILNSMLNDKSLFLKWGDSISESSSLAKKRALPDKNTMGDRIDLRVLTKVDDSYHDLSNCEFANDKLGPGKFTADHLKILRGSKVILDDITNQKFLKAKDARRLIVPSFQANGLEGEIKITKLVAPGLYTVQHLGSVDVPYLADDLSILRIKTIPRLNFMKF